MRVLIINSVCGFGSTGGIVAGIAEDFEKQGHEVKIAYGRKSILYKDRPHCVKIGNTLSVGFHFLGTRLLDRHGLGSTFATKKFLHWAGKYDPDLVWLHNIHGYYLNYKELFKWIKARPDMEVRWTLHDCWAFTGHCSHFLLLGCDKWKTGCERCEAKGSYPTSIWKDRSRKNYGDKKKSFTGIKKLQIITPSNWLKGCVEKSFLKEYKVEAVYNKINKEVFHPVKDVNRIGRVYEKYIGKEIYRKKILLGVAGVWTKEKGYDDFLKLSELLPDKYRIVLTGLSEKQMRKLPDKIFGIPRISSQKELCLLYNGAHCYINLTYEDTFPTTNLEAVACGIPVITYDTGGCKETVEGMDYVVKPGELEKIVHVIVEEIGRKTERL